MKKQGENIILTVEEYKKMTSERIELLNDNLILKEKLAQLQRMIFGKKNEKFIPTNEKQLSLFDDDVQVAENKEVKKEKITYERPKTNKKKPVRTILPAHLPREEEIIEPENLPEKAKKIGEVITEILEYKPGTIFVRRIVRQKYLLPKQEKIVTAELPTLPLPRANAGAGLLSQLTVSKFVDHLPFYRQRQIFKRQGIELAESTINDWYSGVCKLIEPLYDTLKKQIQQSTYIQADESPIPVQTKDKPGATHKGYMWVYHSPPDKMVCFDYQKSRSQDAAKIFLSEFSGILQTDGYAAYTAFGNKPDITLAACMAHARRKFEKSLNNYADIAKYVLVEIQKLYKIEREIKELEFTDTQIVKLRQKKAKPILANLKKYLIEKAVGLLPRSDIGKAIAYTLKLYDRLKVYLTDGRILIDNNLIENSIRPLALGRKNWLFAGSHEAAQRNAMMYSFFGTCKLNKIEPFEWLKNTLNKIPDYNIQNLKELLPGYKAK